MKLFDMIVASKVLGGGGGVTPTGTINITENGQTDVTQYATANVAVPQPSGTVNITQNGDTDVTNYATAHVAVPQPSGKITISQNGTDIDVAQYATADVSVSGSGDEVLAGVIDGTIQSINIPSGITKVRNNAFNGCGNSLKTVSVPNTVTQIGEFAFYYCWRLTTISLQKVTYIFQNAFEGAGLQSVDFGDSLVSLGDSSFRDCGSLAAIDLPSTVTSISSNAFRGCSSLNSITCRATTPPTLQYSSLQNVPSDCAIYVPAASVDAYKAANNWSSRASYIQAIPSA